MVGLICSDFGYKIKVCKSTETPLGNPLFWLVFWVVFSPLIAS